MSIIDSLSDIIVRLREATGAADRNVHDIRMNVEMVEQIAVLLELYLVEETLKTRNYQEKAKGSGGYRSPFEDERSRSQEDMRRSREKMRKDQEEFQRRQREDQAKKQREAEEVLRRFRDAMGRTRGFRFEDYAFYGYNPFEGAFREPPPPPPPKDKKPWYEILGVRATATKPEITKAYRSLAMKHHPDRGGETNKFQEIEAAYREVKKKWKST